MAGKYTPLEDYLRDLPASQREVALGFEQIEGILNNKLPYSAYEDQRGWEHETEGNHINTRAWANAGWRIKNLDVNAMGEICPRSIEMVWFCGSILEQPMQANRVLGKDPDIMHAVHGNRFEKFE